MNSVITIKNFPALPFSEKEILRYAGCRDADESTLKLLKSSVEEIRDKMNFRICYRLFPIKIAGSLCSFGSFSFESKNLAANLAGSKKVLLFAATIGFETDRLIAKYIRLSPARAVMLQAIGAERIEALCDYFCKNFELENNLSLKPRFSPGYGDLPLDAQRKIFSVLDCSKHIAVSLSESLLMSPSKSVTAFAGIRK